MKEWQLGPQRPPDNNLFQGLVYIFTQISKGVNNYGDAVLLVRSNVATVSKL